MAYASLLSLAQTTAEIIFLYPISQNKKQRIRSIYEPFILLQEFLEEFPEKTNSLEGRIRDVAHEAEDIIVSSIMKDAPSHWTTFLAAKLKSRRQMKKIRRQIISITREMKNIKKSCEATTSVAASQLTADSPAGSSVSSKNADTVGLHDDLIAIMYRLCGESPHLQVIPIVGMGGIGKSLVKLHQLENLKLRSAFSNAFCQRDIFTFPDTLKKLSLSRLPLPWDEMTVVGSLPNLRVLKLTHQACKGSTWETVEGEFPLLESLLIEKSYLEHWLTESSHFPRLKWLVLDECSQLTGIPSGIGEIPTLELIEVKGKAKKSLLESTKRIRKEQLEWGNDALKVRCMTR